MKKVIIFCVNNFAEMMCHYLQKSGIEVVAFCIDKKYCNVKTFVSKPVVPFEEITSMFNANAYDFCLCIGYKGMNKLRQEKFMQIKDKGYNIISYFHPTSIIDDKACCGEGTIALEGSIIGYKTQLGVGNVIYPKAQIAHHTCVGDFNFFAVACSIAGSVKIENNCFFGNNSTTKNGITIKNKTL